MIIKTGDSESSVGTEDPFSYGLFIYVGCQTKEPGIYSRAKQFVITQQGRRRVFSNYKFYITLKVSIDNGARILFLLGFGCHENEELLISLNVE